MRALITWIYFLNHERFTDKMASFFQMGYVNTIVEDVWMFFVVWIQPFIELAMFWFVLYALSKIIRVNLFGSRTMNALLIVAFLLPKARFY